MYLGYPKLIVVPLSGGTPVISEVGGKAASLIRLNQDGFAVPDGLVLTSTFFADWSANIATDPNWVKLCDLVNAPKIPHISDLREICESLMTVARQVEFSDIQRQALATIVAELPHERYAVRSSSPDEDLEGMSFAGLYESFLNVGANGLETAVRECFVASLDARIALYRCNRRLSQEDHRFAVIVQGQVDSEISGVAFSINPLSNDYDEVLINAVLGLGESLVSGTVTPYRWVVNKYTGEIVEEGSEASPSQPACLSKSQVDELVLQVKNVEANFENPVDIEWTFVDNRLFLLQARPITTWVPLPDDAITEPADPRILYIDGGLADNFTISGPLTPLSLDFVTLVATWALEFLTGHSNRGETSLRSGLMASTGARLYTNLSNCLHLFNPATFADQRRYIDTTLAEIFATTDFTSYRPPQPPKFLSKTSLFKLLPKALWRVRPFLAHSFKAVFRTQDFLRRYDIELERFERNLAETDRTLPIVDFTRQLCIAYGRVCTHATAPALLHFFFAGLMALDRLIDAKSSEQKHLAEQIKGGGDELIMEMNLAMVKLAKALHSADPMDAESFEENLDTGNLPQQFQVLWRDFMRRFGCRGALEADLINPRYHESPKQLFELLNSFSQEGNFDLEEAMKERNRGQETAFAELRRQLSPRKQKKLDRANEVIRLFKKCREAPKHHLMQFYDLLRQRLLMIAKIWVAEGRIDSQVDIFLLNFADIDRCEHDSAIDIRSLVVENGAFYQKAKTFTPHFPHAIDSRGRILRPRNRNRENTLVGTPVSPGTVRGPVKVLHDPYSKTIESGDVLVTVTTDPGWTPLFVNASAILLEIGGELQHGALIAREYGKPCIAGIQDLTNQLEDGQIVEVDGAQGVVSLCTENEPARLHR